MFVDVRGKNCPVPLVETRKALRRATQGELIEIIGTHPASKKEIPMAAEAMGIEIEEQSEEGGEWRIVLRAP